MNDITQMLRAIQSDCMWTNTAVSDKTFLLTA